MHCPHQCSYMVWHTNASNSQCLDFDGNYCWRRYLTPNRWNWIDQFHHGWIAWLDYLHTVLLLSDFGWGRCQVDDGHWDIGRKPKHCVYSAYDGVDRRRLVNLDEYLLQVLASSGSKHSVCRCYLCEPKFDPTKINNLWTTEIKPKTPLRHRHWLSHIDLCRSSLNLSTKG